LQYRKVFANAVVGEARRGCRTNVRQLILYSTQNAGLRKARRLWYN